MMDWFGGDLQVRSKATGGVVANVRSLSLEQAQRILDKSYPAERYTAIYNPYPLCMEADK